MFPTLNDMRAVKGTGKDKYFSVPKYRVVEFTELLPPLSFRIWKSSVNKMYLCTRHICRKSISVLRKLSAD
jgi:hypothetical protein